MPLPTKPCRVWLLLKLGSSPVHFSLIFRYAAFTSVTTVDSETQEGWMVGMGSASGPRQPGLFAHHLALVFS